MTQWCKIFNCFVCHCVFKKFIAGKKTSSVSHCRSPSTSRKLHQPCLVHSLPMGSRTSVCSRKRAGEVLIQPVELAARWIAESDGVHWGLKLQEIKNLEIIVFPAGPQLSFNSVFVKLYYYFPLRSNHYWQIGTIQHILFSWRQNKIKIKIKKQHHTTLSQWHEPLHVEEHMGWLLSAQCICEQSQFISIQLSHLRYPITIVSDGTC